MTSSNSAISQSAHFVTNKSLEARIIDEQVSS